MLFAPLSSGGRSAEHAPRSVDLAWLCCGPTRGALHPHAVGRGSTAPTPRPSRRQGAQTFLGSACVSRGARPARVSHHGVAADRPRSTRRAERAWRGCGAGQRAASSSPRRRSRRDRTNTATSRRHEDSKCLSQRVWFPWRASRARITPLSSGRRRAEFASRTVDLAWLCVGQLAARFIPTPSDEAQPHQHSDRSEARRSRFFFHRVRTPWRAAHANFALWRIDRPPAGHAPRSADLELLCCGPTRARSSPCRRPGLDRTSTATGRRHGDSNSLRPRVLIPWHASRARIAPWSSGRRTAEHVHAA